MGEPLKVEQALFGYREGHNLVTSSVELNPRVRQFLANVTDGSGPAKSDEFENAYTGLPVPKTDYYAFFCTWPAPEMSRPGCVWSHVLLLQLSDLAVIEDLSILRARCLRPTVPVLLAEYESTLDLSNIQPVESATQFSERHATTIISALYGRPGEGIVILADNNREWNSLLFAVWSQQWPRLRRSFAFSTASFGDRRTIGEKFDIQIGPLSSQRVWSRGGFPTSVIPASSDLQQEIPGWVESGVRSLRSPIGGLRSFFVRFGSDIDDPRKAYSILAEEHERQRSESGNDIVEGLRKIGSAFPAANDALSLKRDRLTMLFEGSKVRGGNLLEGLALLLDSTYSSAFSQISVNLQSCASILWREKRVETLSILARMAPNSRTLNIVNVFANVLGPHDIPVIWEEQPQVLERLIEQRLPLLFSPDAWAMEQDGQRVLWDMVREQFSDSKTWASILAVMLRSRCSFREVETVILANGSLLDGLQEWLTDSGISLPSAAWRSALRVPVTELVRGSELSPAVLALAGFLLLPEDSRSISGKRSDIQALADGLWVKLPQWLRLRTAFWLVSVGLNTRGLSGLLLLKSAFPAVYEAVARSQYQGESWELVEPLLPRAFFGREWDRCKQLRRGVKEWRKDNSEYASDVRNSLERYEEWEDHSD